MFTTVVEIFLWMTGTEFTCCAIAKMFSSGLRAASTSFSAAAIKLQRAASELKVPLLVKEGAARLIWSMRGCINSGNDGVRDMMGREVAVRYNVVVRRTWTASFWLIIPEKC